MTRRRERPEKSAFAIAPVPGWLSELAGAEVTKAAAWRSGRAVYLRVATGAGPRLLELAWDRGERLHGHRIEPGTTPPRRRPLAALDAMGAERRDEVERFVRRVDWMHAREGAASTGYRPSGREAWYRTVARALSRVHAPADAARVPSARDVADPTLRGVELYLDVLKGRWDRVFAEVDDPTTPPPPWLAPLLVGLGGDADAMRSLAAEAVGAGAGEGVLAILAAVAFERSGFHRAARQAFRTAVEALAGPMRADLCVVLARQCRVDGLEEEAVAWARRALLIRSDDDHLMARACFELIRCGALDDAYAVLRERCAREPVDGDAALGLAELLLWAGRTEEARPWLDRALASRPEDARALRCVGVMHALEGRWSEARDAFSRALGRAPGDMETATWLSEAHLRLGDRSEAERMLIESRAVAQTPVHLVLGAALYEVAHVVALLDVLGEPVEPWLESPEAATKEALSLLDGFGGNRGKPLTRLDGDPSESRLGLRVVRVPQSDSVLSSRDASADTLKLLGTIPLAELEQRFEELAERYPESPHPLCYRGELDLWLGDYERAIARFEAALSRSQARWGYVGQAAARILRGEYEAADEAIAACNREFAPVVGATTHVYVGEALRRRGDLQGAVAELTEAVRVKPGRAGAWMNLALARRALGAHDDARRIFHQLEARLPRLYWDAWRALGEAPRWPIPPERMPDLFEKALEMMRGNRSSHTVTYFDAAGVFRIARDAEDWRVAAAHHGSFLALGLQSRLAAGETG